MNGTTHMAVGGMVGGVTIAAAVAARTLSFDFFGYEIYPLVVTAAGAIGGLAPDVDIAHSRAGRFLRKFLRISLISSAIFMMVMFFLPHTGIAFLDGAAEVGATLDRGFAPILAAFSILTIAIIEKSKHRGFTHSIPGLGLVSFPLLFMLVTGVMFVGANIAVSAQLGFVAGWFSHMVIDTFNTRGIRWLWPITKKRFRLMKITTGSANEDRFLVFCVVVFVCVYGMVLVGV